MGGDYSKIVQEMIKSELTLEQEKDLIHLENRAIERQDGGIRYFDYTTNKIVTLDPKHNSYTEAASKPRMDICAFIEKLTPEIRAKIYGYLYVRPDDIMPTMIRYNLEVTHPGQEASIYSYHWASRRPIDDELPHYNGTMDLLHYKWVTDPTRSQREDLINKEIYTQNFRGERVYALGTTRDKEHGGKIRHLICHRGQYGTKIINNARVITTGIQGIALLRTCKKICEEATPFLYGRNKFRFDTKGDSATNIAGFHPWNAFNERSWLIPGFFTETGAAPTKEENKRLVSMMFDKSEEKATFILKDPVTRFFTTIGRKNTALITEVAIEGAFLVSYDLTTPSDKRPIRFDRLLPIYTTVLKYACPRLDTLALHQHYKSIGQMARDEDEAGMDDHFFYKIVSKMANSLGSLRVLRLEDYNFEVPIRREDRPDPVLPWGKALELEEMVDNRFQWRKKRKAILKWLENCVDGNRDGDDP